MEDYSDGVSLCKHATMNDLCTIDELPKRKRDEDTTDLQVRMRPASQVISSSV